MAATSKDFPPQQWKLRLYVVGQTSKSRGAVERIQGICKRYLQNNCDLEIIDLLESPEKARIDQVLAVPALIRLEPLPLKKLVGDLRNVQAVLEGLEIDAKDEGGRMKVEG